MLWRKRSKLYERVGLRVHPDEKPSPLISLTVDYRRDGSSLVVEFVAEESWDAIVWPELAEPHRTDDLWRTTCFELFVQTDDGYVEYNLSPSSAWATYRFDAYRQGMRPAPEFVSSSGMRFEGPCALLRAQILLPPDATRLGFAAVIESTDGRFAHWALAHPAAKPDFHHPDSCTLVLT